MSDIMKNSVYSVDKDLFGHIRHLLWWIVYIIPKKSACLVILNQSQLIEKSNLVRHYSDVFHVTKLFRKIETFETLIMPINFFRWYEAVKGRITKKYFILIGHTATVTHFSNPAHFYHVFVYDDDLQQLNELTFNGGELNNSYYWYELGRVFTTVIPKWNWLLLAVAIFITICRICAT